MNKQLKTELDTALRDVGNAAEPLADDRVREVIAGLRMLQRRIVEGGSTNLRHFTGARGGLASHGLHVAYPPASGVLGGKARKAPAWRP
jgi:hypothetical protein